MRVNTGLSAEWFTPRGLEKDSGVRFKLSPIDNLTMADIISEGTMRGSNFQLSKEGRRILLAKGLVGWEGIEDQDGKPLEFDQKNIQFIPYPMLLEVAMKLIELSTIGAEDKKN